MNQKIDVYELMAKCIFGEASESEIANIQELLKNDADLQELEQFCKNILNYMNNEDIVRTVENGESTELEDKELLG